MIGRSRRQAGCRYRHRPSRRRSGRPSQLRRTCAASRSGSGRPVKSAAAHALRPRSNCSKPVTADFIAQLQAMNCAACCDRPPTPGKRRCTGKPFKPADELVTPRLSIATNRSSHRASSCDQPNDGTMLGLGIKRCGRLRERDHRTDSPPSIGDTDTGSKTPRVRAPSPSAHHEPKSRC
jgi:hypothetical protein